MLSPRPDRRPRWPAGAYAGGRGRGKDGKGPEAAARKTGGIPLRSGGRAAEGTDPCLADPWGGDGTRGPFPCRRECHRGHATAVRRHRGGGRASGSGGAQRRQVRATGPGAPMADRCARALRSAPAQKACWEARGARHIVRGPGGARGSACASPEAGAARWPPTARLRLLGWRPAAPNRPGPCPNSAAATRRPEGRSAPPHLGLPGAVGSRRRSRQAACGYRAAERRRARAAGVRARARLRVRRRRPVRPRW